MAWNQSGGDQGAKRRPGAAAGGAAWWRSLKQRWSGSRGARGPLYAAGVAAALLLWLLSGFYQIAAGQHALLERFGAYAGERGAGLGWHLPWPIESVTRIDLGRVNSVDFQARMLSADTALLNITGSVQYQLRDARQALYALRESERTVRELGEAATRELLATQSLSDVLNGTGRGPLVEALRGTVQRRLDDLSAGVRVMAVNLTDVQVPEPVLESQRGTEQAQQERKQLALEAQGYAGDLLPRAQELAQRQRTEAEAYKLQIIATAEGDAARFEPLLAAYERAPEVTRNRLYIETIETILARSRKVIIDGKGTGNTFSIPLEKLLDASTARTTGVAGVVAAPPPASAPGAKVAPAGERDGRERDRAER